MTHPGNPTPPENLPGPARPDFVRRPARPVIPRRRRFIRKEKIAPAFWTVAGVISLVVNIVLLVAVLALARQLFALKELVSNQLVGGLYQNFVLMDQARIQTTIPVQTSVKAKFDVPFETDTTVTLTKDTPIQSAVVSVHGGIIEINQAPTDILLPAGTKLPIHLNITVPIDQEIPVNLDVKVDIPLNQTDLHKPFVGLQQVVQPYYRMLADTPDSWEELLCPKGNGLLCWLGGSKQER